MRRERALAAVNGGSLLLAVALAWFSVVVVGSALATVLSVTVSVVVRSLILELVASRALGLPRRPRTLTELGVSVLFVVATGSHVGWATWVAVAVAWVGYLWWCRSLLGALLVRLPGRRERRA
jgi:hypothetical protein